MNELSSSNYASISQSALSDLMPLHILLDQDGELRGAGRIIQKFLPCDMNQLDDVLILTRPRDEHSMLLNLRQAAHTGERIEMQLRAATQVKLRGHVRRIGNGNLLLNLGFGMFLREAISNLNLSDADFPPSSHVVEYMFLHEANRGVMRELSLFNLRLKGAHAMAEAQAHTDALTGLQNRRGLLLMLEAALAEITDLDCDTNRHLAVAQIDLDHFKPVNDRLGHAAGDAVLCRAARVLRDVTRSADTVARIGGDEFVLVLRDIDNPKTLKDLGARIIQGIEKPVTYNGDICQVSASIGIVLIENPDDLHIEKILADADAALYCSKRDGRGRTTVLRASELDGANARDDANATNEFYQ